MCLQYMLGSWFGQLGLDKFPFNTAGVTIHRLRHSSALTIVHAVRAQLAHFQPAVHCAWALAEAL